VIKLTRRQQLWLLAQSAGSVPEGLVRADERKR